MKKILHIAAHLGAGAGKAISGIVSGTEEYQNTVLLLEEPVQWKYPDICRKSGAEVIVSDNTDEIRCIMESADAVIFDWWGHPLFYNVLKAVSGIETRLILWSHINGLFYPFLQYDFLEQFDYSMFTSACTYENSDWTEKQKNIISEKSEIIYGMGNFEPEMNPFRTDYSAGKPFKIGYAGTISFGKMSADFPEICRKMSERIDDTEFIFYGSSEKATEEAFGNPKCKFCGFTDNLEEKLKELDVFCYPLCAENFATTENALLEAMAAALPAVVLNNSPERNIIKHNETGLIAENPEQMCSYLEMLYKDEKLRARLGKNARKNVISRCSYNENCIRYKKCIEKVLTMPAKRHDFSKIIGSSPWEYFLYLSGRNNKKIADIINDGKNVKLPDIFYEKSKSSPLHFLRYFEDNRFNKITDYR